MPAKKAVEDVELEGELLNYVSYATYYCRRPLFTSFKICNRGEKALEGLTVGLCGSTELILPRTVPVPEISPESSVSLSVEEALNPKYLADLAKPENCTVTVQLTGGSGVICTLQADLQALPINYFGGVPGDAETLACFVRPRLADCQKILAEAGLQLKTWGYSSEWAGYAAGDKSAVRGAFAALFSAIRRQEVSSALQEDVFSPVSVGDVSRILTDKSASPLGMAAFAASCLEAAKLNPVILLGKNKAGVGVWLYESCFSSAVQDDMQLIEKYVAEGVNNLAVFDVDDLFAHKNASCATSEAHFLSALTRGEYEICIDVKRCRIGGQFPMPIKVKTAAGYELLDNKQFSYDEKPDELIRSQGFEYARAASKDKNWQRRLLDLSLKNNLLNFRYSRDCLHIVCASAAGFTADCACADKFTLTPSESEKLPPFGGGAQIRNLAELISIEMKGGTMRCASSAENLNEVTSSLIRKARAAEEEAGAKTLYLAVGFLGWKYDGEKELKYAPITLLPVVLKRLKGKGAAVEISEECEVNTTLLEFLKQEFDVDLRGIEDGGLTPAEALAAFRSKTADRRGWKVFEDVYLSHFTFARYAMWADVKNNINEYRRNPIIEGLLTNANTLTDNKLSAAGEDDADPCAVLTPLACDSTQYAAVAQSAKGATFVLHGPPGTGKSQTITNIIANALASGKRVLFVAEKQAALQVVEKRLKDIGLGDFCLNLHSGKADKAEIVRSIENTLSLSAGAEDDKFAAVGARIAALRSDLKQPSAALHKKRRLGVSVYEGILYYLQNKSAPELINIESSFYDSLTAAKLEEYERMLSVAQAAAKECGGIYRSPFSGINLTSCDKDVKTSVLCSAEVVLAELKHLKNYLGLFLEAFNQKISTFTDVKLENLIGIVRTLKSGELEKFFCCDEAEFYKFYNANLRYDSEVKHWLNTFRALPDIEKYADDIESELDKWGENHRSSKILLAVIKRINRLAPAPLKESEEAEWIKRAYEIEKARAMILSSTDLSRNFSYRGSINDRKREEFLKPLYNLHGVCAKVFMDYNADAFNSACAGAGGTFAPLLSGFLTAADGFVRACENFRETVKADAQLFENCDLFEKYSSKCAALIDNIDMLPAWCMYKSTAKKLDDCGLTFLTDAMESGRISGKQILSSFRKNVYRNFIQTNIPADEYLSVFSASVMEEDAAAFARALEEFSSLTRAKIRAELVSRLPSKETEGALAVELMTFQRSVKGNMRSLNLRALFSEIPELLRVTSPCMLMSPITVSQYLPPSTDLFDMVIFDEASQMPTCEAVPSLARAKSAVIVGDPKQMPPTAFFMGGGQDEDNPETEDLESVLDDCLALGIPEMHLIWHYRSKHESLIAFSNVSYYSNKLCTFPSPDALDSKVKLRYAEDGVYDRGQSKCNKKEAELLVAEVVRRLKDERLKKSSIGVVTFSAPQQVYIEKLLNKAISSAGLDDAAYSREEPLFVKNLENVQGDERDVILFSVCYGPDSSGKISLNFGPLNQFGGWRRLNVAVSRAREEMIVFSSMRYSMIDLSRTTSRGVAGLKAFLEFAEKGRTSISVKSDEIIFNKTGIGKYIAEELSGYGYDCRCDVGVSDFKIDVAVLNPRNKREFILAILCDGPHPFSVKDRFVMQVQTLKRNNWNVYKLYSINFFNNPKREIKKIKDYLDRLTNGVKNVAAGFKKPYKTSAFTPRDEDAAFVLAPENEGEILRALKATVSAEEPISSQFLIKRTLSLFGVAKCGVKTESRLRGLISKCGFSSVEVMGTVYYGRTEKCFSYDRYRAEEGAQVRSSDADYTPFDVISAIRAILLGKVSMYADELIPAVLKELKVPRQTEKLCSFVSACIDEGVRRGLLVRSVSDKISLV